MAELIGGSLCSPLKALQAFDHAARTGSFKSAAQTLHVSPTAISHRIRALEEDLGVALFASDGRKATLNAHGQNLGKKVAEAFAQLKLAVERTRRSPGGQVIRIAAGPFLATRWPMPRLANFWVENPRISLEMVPVPQRLSGREIDADIAISWDDATEDNARPLLTLTPFAIASPDLIDRLGRPSHPGDLLQLPLIHQRDISSWSDWFAAMGIAKAKPLQGPVFEDANAVLRGAVDGQGVTLRWMPLIGNEIETGRLIQLF